MSAAPLSTDAVRSRLAALMPELRQQHGVRSLALFGSYARGEQTAQSDLDLLVEFDRTPGLLGFVALAQALEDQLGLRVDLATRPMVGPRLAPHVQADLLAV